MANKKTQLAHTFMVSGVLIENQGKFLLVQEKKPEAYGKWNIPGGRVDKGESLEAAAIRETKEECGYEVKLKRHLLTLHQATDKPVLHVYEASIVSGELIFPEHEILDAKWFTTEEIKSMADELRTPAYVIGALDAWGD